MPLIGPGGAVFNNFGGTPVPLITGLHVTPGTNTPLVNTPLGVVASSACLQVSFGVAGSTPGLSGTIQIYDDGEARMNCEYTIDGSGFATLIQYISLFRNNHVTSFDYIIGANTIVGGTITLDVDFIFYYT